jgi:hypothetical protein
LLRARIALQQVELALVPRQNDSGRGLDARPGQQGEQQAGDPCSTPAQNRYVTSTVLTVDGGSTLI